MELKDSENSEGVEVPLESPSIMSKLKDFVHVKQQRNNDIHITFTPESLQLLSEVYYSDEDDHARELVNFVMKTLKN